MAQSDPIRRPTIARALRRARRRVRQTVREPSGGVVLPARAGVAPVALVVLGDGRAYCMPDRCPHDGGPLSDGFVDGGRLVCARHGWEFDPATGACPLRPSARVESTPVDGPPAGHGPLFAFARASRA